MRLLPRRAVVAALGRRTLGTTPNSFAPTQAALPRHRTAADLYAALVFLQPTVAVRTVIVDGRVVVERGVPTFLGADGDLAALVREASERSRGIADRARLQVGR